MITHTSIADLEKMPLSKLFDYNRELEAALKTIKPPQQPGKK
jgi:hypothetical protein